MVVLIPESAAVVGPACCVQARLAMEPSASEAEPLTTTLFSGSEIVTGTPASTTGGLLVPAGNTVKVTSADAVEPKLSVTSTRKTYVPTTRPDKAREPVLAPPSVAVDPLSLVHR